MRLNVVRRAVGDESLLLPVTDTGPAGGQVAILLHGFPQNASMWQATEPGLHDLGLRTLAVDQRGYSPGARPADPASYRLPELVDDALAVLDAAGAERAVLVGHDWGALVAWALAARHPERVRAVVALAVPHPRAFGAALAADAEQQRRSAYITLFRQSGRAEQVLLADGARRLRDIFAGSGLDDAEVERYVAPLASAEALAGALAWYRGPLGEELAAVGPVRVPSSYVYADGDVAVSPAAADGCAQWVEAPYTRVDLPGASHWIPDQHPDAVVAAVAGRIATDPA